MSVASAGTWCQWDGSKGINCQSDSKGYIYIDGFKVSTPERANNAGYYKVAVVEPVINFNQIVDQETWAFTGNTIIHEWTVRDRTAEEIDLLISKAMPKSEYYIWKALLVKGVVTQQEAATALPQELIDAYMARDRLENP
jgi:hypothetical protein